MNDINPSAFLFPVSVLSKRSTQDVAFVLEKLRGIFRRTQGPSTPVSTGGFSCAAYLVHSTASTPVKCVANSLEQELITDSGYASAEDDDDDVQKSIVIDESVEEAMEMIRHDPFERDFVTRWLTSFISRSSTWAYSYSDDTSDNESGGRGQLVESAASLLSFLAGADEEEEALTREFEFLLGEGDVSGRTSITAELNDAPLSSTDHSSVGLQSWASSIIFARMLCHDPGSFGLKTTSARTLRVLELGAGTGLLAIATAKILAGYRHWHSFTPEVVATDYHPDVLSNLCQNVKANFPAVRDSDVAINVAKFDWEHPSFVAPFNEEFDVILAADVIYDPCHAAWIRDCVSRLLRRPSESSSGGHFWMAIPIRTTGRHEGMYTRVTDVFPVAEGGKSLFETPTLKTIDMQELSRCDGVGRADESGYRLFRICWV